MADVNELTSWGQALLETRDGVASLKADMASLREEHRRSSRETAEDHTDHETRLRLLERDYMPRGDIDKINDRVKTLETAAQIEGGRQKGISWSWGIAIWVVSMLATQITPIFNLLHLSGAVK